MRPTPNEENALHFDGARHTLCSQIADMLRAGRVRLRVRIHLRTGEAWFYVHYDNTWHKQEGTLHNAQLVQELGRELAMLASKPHGDDVQVTRHAVADWEETELQFHRDAIERHVDEKLESFVFGLLFGDHHDTKQDVRRHVQSGPRHAGQN